MSAMTPKVEVGQLWERKSDRVLVAVRELTGSSHSFTRLQNLRTGRHFEATAPQIQKRYEFKGYDVSERENACPGSWSGAVGRTDPCSLCGEVAAKHLPPDALPTEEKD